MRVDIESHMKDLAQRIAEHWEDPEYEPAHPNCQCVIVAGVWIQQPDSVCDVCTQLREEYNEGMANDDRLAHIMQELLEEYRI